MNEKFKDGAGGEQNYDLPLVTLPAGTVLFRGVKIPDTSLGQDIRYFYRDFLGNPEADGTVCMSPVHNVFFYPFPHVFYGAHTIGETFNMLEIVVLVHPVNIVCAISPSSWVRGQGQRYSGTAPWQRCGGFEGPDVDCHEPSFREREAKNYDNCLLPEYQLTSGTRGWMAIADLDSINTKKKQWGSTKPKPMKESTMGSYIRDLYKRQPEEAIDLLIKTYKDDHQHAGYPEIALYPYKNHPGRRLITRTCKTDQDAIKIMEREASDDNLNYLPLALITKDGVIDMVNGHFIYSRTGVTYNRSKNFALFNPAMARPSIEQHARDYVKSLQEKGITLPFYGKSKLSFDTRTGFYIFPTVIPSNLKIKIPESILYKNAMAAKPANADKKAYEKENYRNFCMDLITEEDKRRARIYELMFRSFLPDHFLEKYGLEPGYGRRRALIFERFPFVETLFKELEIPIPKELPSILGRAGALYAKEAGKKKKPKPVAASNSAGEAAAAAEAMNLGAAPGTPLYAPASPAYYPEAPKYGDEEELPPLGGKTPDYNAGLGGMTPGYNAGLGGMTPEYNAGGAAAGEAYSPHTPEFGGAGLAAASASAPAAAARTPPAPPAVVGGRRRKTRTKARKHQRKTRKANNSAENKVNSHAMLFNRIWKVHGAVKHKPTA